MKYYTLKHENFFVERCGFDGSLDFFKGNVLTVDNLSTDYDYLSAFAEFWNREQPLLEVEVVEVILIEKNMKENERVNVLGVNFF